MEDKNRGARCRADRLPDPGRYRSFYITYDVTGLLQEGVNAVGVILGNGRYFSPRIKAPTLTLSYGYPKLLLQLEIEYEDDSSIRVVSDGSWKLTTETIKPVALSNPAPGVFIYDMGQNMVGWTKLSVKAGEGSVIKQRFAETLKEDGTLYLANIRESPICRPLKER